MGSKADEAHAQKIAESLKNFGLNCFIRIGSAHKTVQHTVQMLAEYEADPAPKVYITIAGRSNALSGFTDGSVCAPVIACPPPSDTFGGADIFSSLRMPSGIAPAVVLEPVNAALLAAKILALVDNGVRERVAEYQRQNAEHIIAADRALHSDTRRSEK